ncbi:DUF6256 family protein [Streptomyces hoynatensis]|uniref:Uncharacterized protein n=1 Tax=Streptomyces hoynatensis TaxID=1141874 RepID=A0A3A9Z6Q2_9ACTN|nr:DUF6256 family protein [Streptomyces hoynatensis]RKN42986.1 hypothetical protein D7294_10710 [Streptomyces hoynatensis]
MTAAVTAAGYLLVMALLATGLRLMPGRARPPRRTGTGLGRPALLRQALATACGGWLLLTAVAAVFALVPGGLGGGFLWAAANGTALLTGLALPLFLAASLAETRLRERRARRLRR